MAATLILISRREEDRQFIAGVSASAGFPAQIFDTPSSAARVAHFEDQAILFVDVTSDQLLKDFENAFSPKLGDESGKIQANHVHLIGSEKLPSLDAIGSFIARFSHFISRRSASDLEESGKHYGRVLNSLQQLKKIGFEPKISVSLQHSSQKTEALTKVENFIRENTSFVDRSVPPIVTAVDELLMNAIYDAPIDSRGGQMHRNLGRDRPVDLPGGQAVVLQMSFDGEYVAFTVSDRFGSIDRNKLLNHLLAQHVKDTLTVDPTGAGAGIGLVTSFMAGGSLVFLYEPGVRTEVSVLFRQTKNFREFKEQFHFFSVHRSS